MKPIWWGNRNKAAKSAYLACPTCPKHNAKKHAHTAHLKLPKGPFAVWQMDFIQLPPSHGFKYALVMVCRLSPWANVLSCRQTTAASVAKILLGRKKKKNPNVEKPSLKS